MSENQNFESTNHVSPFEEIRKTTEDGGEYWFARDLARILGYTRYDKFQNVLQKAELACINSGQPLENHMSHVRRMVDLGSGARREVSDVHLSRYACYLVIQNADPSKEIVALGQTYFAVQTHRQEQSDQLLENLSEDQKRLYMRERLAEQNVKLAEAARRVGIVQPKDYAIFQDHGYMGLYAGERAKDIHERKGLKSGQKILDHMGYDELVANAFRSSLAEQRIRRDDVEDKDQANQTHLRIGQLVRDTIREAGGTLPENAPTPKESIQQLQQKQKKLLKQATSQQPSLFDGLTTGDDAGNNSGQSGANK